MKTTISAKGCSTLLTVKVMPIKNNNGKPFVPIIKIPVIKNCVKYRLKNDDRDFPISPVVKNLPCNAGDADLIPQGN